MLFDWEVWGVKIDWEVWGVKIRKDRGARIFYRSPSVLREALDWNLQGTRRTERSRTRESRTVKERKKRAKINKF